MFLNLGDKANITVLIQSFIIKNTHKNKKNLMKNWKRYSRIEIKFKTC